MDAIIGILNNPILLTFWGYVVSYVPGIRAAIPQWTIPFLNVLRKPRLQSDRQNC